MKVSAIVCTYNRAGLLKSATDRILSNSYPDFDLMIADQSENDEIKNLVNEYINCEKRIKYLCSKKCLFCLLGIYELLLWTFFGILKSFEYSVDNIKDFLLKNRKKEYFQ